MEKRNPWAWIPSLYFAEGLPYVVVMTLSVIMYKRLGVSNTDIALFTSWLYFPWVIKPIWSPFVDLIKTKRWWIYSMQLLIGGGMAGVAFVLPGDFFLRFTLAFFWLMAGEFRAEADTTARYRCGWVLYAGLDGGATSVLYRYPKYVLQGGDANGTRSAGHAGGAFGGEYRTDFFCLESGVFRIGRYLYRLGFVA